MKTIVPNPISSVAWRSKTSVTVKWKKIVKATKYSIYVCKDLDNINPIWKKVKTVNSKKLSCVVKGLKSGKRIGIRVQATVSYGNRAYKSANTEYAIFKINKR